MKRMRKVALLLVAALAAAVLGGCGGSFDASAYVKALMDNSYKGGFQCICGTEGWYQRTGREIVRRRH